MCSKTHRPYKQVVASGSTTGQFIPTTPWLPSMAMNEAKVLLQLENRTSNFQVTWGIQTASTDTDAPDAPIAKDLTYIDTNTKETSGVVNLSADLNTKFFVRLGIFVKNSSGSAFERGEVTMVAVTRT